MNEHNDDHARETGEPAKKVYIKTFRLPDERVRLGQDG